MQAVELPLVHFLSLGCFKNTVDSEGMIRDLVREGFRLTDSPEEAGVIVVNTCCFIDLAKEESIDAVLEASLLKEKGRAEFLVVVGCLVERYKREFERLLPEVDLFLDLREEEAIGRKIRERLGMVSESAAIQDPGRIPLTPSHLAFLKIAEGCSRRCTFCTIPEIRGPFRCRDADDLVREASYLESTGVKELCLISQDTVSYRDGKGRGIDDLVSMLLAKTGMPWVRLLYLNPSGLGERLVDLLCREERLLGYVDMPIQHASSRVLRRMGRGMGRMHIERLVERLRERIPGLTLRTTVLVGFPGETDEDFRELLAFLEEARFERLGAFAFSREEGTPAARLPRQVPGEVVAQRFAEVMELGRRISRENCRGRVGEVTSVLVDRRVEPEEAPGEAGFEDFYRRAVRFIGRSRREAYDVDGLIYLAGNFTPGEFARIRIVDSSDYDLVGVPLD